MDENRPRLAKIDGGGTGFIHPCQVCGDPVAPFGVNVSLRNSRPGSWRCRAHRDVELQTVPAPKAEPVKKPEPVVTPEPVKKPVPAKPKNEEQGSLF